MNRPDHDTFREWLNLEADGALAPERRAPLEEHLAVCAECRAERDALLALAALLDGHRAAVRPELRARVMASLPPVGWESRSPRTWAFPAAVFALLAGISLFAVGGGSHSSVFSALEAFTGLLSATAVAGAGLIAASWKGLGLAFGELFSSTMSMVVFGVFVLCLNLVLFSLLRRRRPATAREWRRKN
jgi:anti-sigma factor RsiW